MSWGQTVPPIVNDEQVEFFRQNGYLKVDGFVSDEELNRLQEETMALVDHGLAEFRDEPGYYYAPSETGEGVVLSRIDFITGRCDSCKWLIGHPDLLRMVKRISGKDFLSIGDAMVVKVPGEGAQVTWHRDHGSAWAGTPQNYNVDIYLDDAPEETCLWAIPGSNLWPDEKAAPFQRKDCVPSEVPEAVPMLMKAGDVILHDARLIHGSPRTSSESIRRTFYCWFYSLKALEPFDGTPGYQAKRWRALHQCIEARKKSPYAAGEAPFEYRAEVPGSTLDGPDVSHIYTEHGYWDPARVLPASGTKR